MVRFFYLLRMDGGLTRMDGLKFYSEQNYEALVLLEVNVGV